MVTVCELIKLLDKDINKTTARGTERILAVCVNGRHMGYVTSAKLDGWGSGLISDITLELSTDDKINFDFFQCAFYLFCAFPECFLNQHQELIVHKASNTYICLSDCRNSIDIKCKVLEWFSRPASKGQPYRQEWRNRKFRKFMLDGINNFLKTDFTEDEMEIIYQYLGNAINHDKTLRFIKSGYDLSVLEDNT